MQTRDTDEMLEHTQESPLTQALAARMAPMVEQLLLEAIQDCPEGFARTLSERFSAQALAPGVVGEMQTRPELLEHLYPNAAQG